MTLRHRILPAKRIKQLKELLSTKSKLRIIETHNGLSGVIGTSAAFVDEQGQTCEFDGLWISSLTDSAAKAHPDTEVIDTSSRLLTIQEILQVTDKPIIVDGDTGGEPTQFEYFCSKLENLGVSAVVIEDKQHPKRNSLDAEVAHVLEDPYKFAAKIDRAKAICLSSDFMIFTRIESFIAKRSLEDAMMRASIYLESQADGILIHSNQNSPDQVYAFMDAYKKLCAKKGIHKPVLCVPTTYNHVTDDELFDKGFNVVIYANHLLRASHKAMVDTCQTILAKKRSQETNESIATVKDVMEAVGFYDVKLKDAKYKQKSIPVILLGSGEPQGFKQSALHKLPVSNIPIAGKPLLHWQVAALKQAGLSNITLVSGYARDQLGDHGLDEIFNGDYANTKVLSSLMMANAKMDKGFVMVFGDIFFDKKLLVNHLINVDSDILLLVDHSFNLYTRKHIKPTTDLVILNNPATTLRKPNVVTEQILEIGNDIPLEQATHEFIGIAKFSAKGAQQLCEAYESLKSQNTPEQLSKLDFYDVIRKLLSDGIAVDAKDINHGWSEVHNMTDVSAIEKDINRLQQTRRSPELV